MIVDILVPLGVLLILFVLAPLTVFRGIKMLRDSDASGGERGGEMMRKSDLDRMIRDAVLDATAPLEARIDDLEREVLVGSDLVDRIAPEALSEAFDAEPLASESDVPRTRQRA